MMQHLTTRIPPSVHVTAKPSHLHGWLATATDSSTGRREQVWGPSEADAKARAECLVCLREAA